MRSIADLLLRKKMSALTVAVGLALTLGAPCAMANTLTEVQINAETSNNGGGYGIVLKTDEQAHMKKVVSSNDKMSIELKDVDVSENLNTVYNNVANLDNVTIQPVSKNDIKIIFKGSQIANSKVYFETVKTVAAPSVAPAQSIKLSGPVSSYTPVYNPSNFAQDESQTANPELNEVLTKMHVSRGMLLTVKNYAKKVVNKAKTGDINIMTILGVALVFAAFVFRPRKKKNAARNLKNLNSAPMTNIDREIGLNRIMASNTANTLNDRNASNMNAVGGNYAFNAYKNSQKNPYASSVKSADRLASAQMSGGVSGLARRKPLGNAAGSAVKSSQAMKAPQRPAQQMRKAPVQAAPLQTAPSMNPVRPSSMAMKTSAPRPLQPSDLDSMKFLESITKIYEKNGRTDLAKGLKDNLKKAQMTRV